MKIKCLLSLLMIGMILLSGCKAKLSDHSDLTGAVAEKVETEESMKETSVDEEKEETVDKTPAKEQENEAPKEEAPKEEQENENSKEEASAEKQEESEGIEYYKPLQKIGEHERGVEFTEEMILTKETDHPLGEKEIISIAQNFIKEQYGEAVKDYQLISCREAYGAMVLREEMDFTNDYVVSFGLLYGEDSFVQGNTVSLRMSVYGGVLYTSPWTVVEKLDRSLVDSLKTEDLEELIRKQIKEVMGKEESYLSDIGSVNLVSKEGSTLLEVYWKSTQADGHGGYEEYMSYFDIQTLSAIGGPEYQAHY